MHKDPNNEPLSQIIINTQVAAEVEQLQQALKDFITVSIYYEDFLIEHTKEITKAAYIAESSTKYIIIAGLSFNQYVQNSLLKLLEEPPRHIRFILVAPSKSILLPTILSRLPILRRSETTPEALPIELSFRQLELASIYDFLKKHERLSKREAKGYVQALFLKASHELGTLNQTQLHAFEQALPLLELNARPLSVFSSILLSFLTQKSHA